MADRRITILAASIIVISIFLGFVPLFFVSIDRRTWVEGVNVSFIYGLFINYYCVFFFVTYYGFVHYNPRNWPLNMRVSVVTIFVVWKIVGKFDDGAICLPFLLNIFIFIFFLLFFAFSPDCLWAFFALVFFIMRRHRRLLLHPLPRPRRRHLLPLWK